MLRIVVNAGGPYEYGGGCVSHEKVTLKVARRPGLSEGIIASLFPEIFKDGDPEDLQDGFSVMKGEDKSIITDEQKLLTFVEKKDLNTTLKDLNTTLYDANRRLQSLTEGNTKALSALGLPNTEGAIKSPLTKEQAQQLSSFCLSQELANNFHMISVCAPNFQPKPYKNDHFNANLQEWSKWKGEEDSDHFLPKDVKKYFDDMFQNMFNKIEEKIRKAGVDEEIRVYLKAPGTSIFNPFSKDDDDRDNYVKAVNSLMNEALKEKIAEFSKALDDGNKNLVFEVDERNFKILQVEKNDRVSFINPNSKVSEFIKSALATNNIIGLKEGGKQNTIYAAGNENHYTQDTIQKNKEDTVFVFGGNVEHTKNRGAAGGGQAIATGGNLNVFPIMTMGDISDEDLKIYNEKTEKILTTFVANGGKVVFPLTKYDGVNVGTGIASGTKDTAKEEFIDKQRYWAKKLYNSLKGAKVDQADPITVMADFCTQMDALQKDMKERAVPPFEEQTVEKKRNTLIAKQEEDYKASQTDPTKLKEYLNRTSYVGWGAKIKQNIKGEYEITDVTEGGFAAAIDLKIGQKITIEGALQQEGGVDLMTTLACNLRRGDLTGIKSIGDYDISDNGNRDKLSNLYKKNQRIFTKEGSGYKLDGEEVKVVNLQDNDVLKEIKKSSDDELKQLITNYVTNKVVQERQALEESLTKLTMPTTIGENGDPIDKEHIAVVASGEWGAESSKSSYLESRNVVKLINHFTNGKDTQYRQLSSSSNGNLTIDLTKESPNEAIKNFTKMDVSCVTGEDKRVFILADGYYFSAICQERNGEGNWVTKFYDVDGDKAKEVMDSAGKTNGVNKTGFIKHDATCGIGAACMAVNFFNNNGVNIENGQDHIQLFGKILTKSPSASPSSPSASFDRVCTEVGGDGR